MIGTSIDLIMTKYQMQSLLKGMVLKSTFLVLAGIFLTGEAFAQETRLLRQPSVRKEKIAFSYGGDIWITGTGGGEEVIRLTSTPAVESDPHLSPDGKWVAFTSNRSGNQAVYLVRSGGGEAERLTWHPRGATVRGWTRDGKRVLYVSTRETAPVGYHRLWSVSAEGGPSKLVTAQWVNDASFSPDGRRLVIDRIRRWDQEWRAYRGGQNTPLIILDLEDFSETLLPNESTTDIHPVWLGDRIYFLSDRDMTMNIWSCSPGDQAVTRVTDYRGSDIKWLDGEGEQLLFERDGYLHRLDLTTGDTSRIHITVRGDFPWAGETWEDLSKRIGSVSLSPTGKRALLESRGEVYTIPVEHGDARSLTGTSGAADRSPVWSPRGDSIAWFSDEGAEGYRLKVAGQDGLSDPRSLDIGISRLGWEPAWSPDGKYLAFTDDDVRVRIADMTTGQVETIDTAGMNLERGSMGLTWSTDSRWLAYSRTGSNHFRRIVVWSLDDRKAREITNAFADSYDPAWDRDGRHLYFLASTDVALGSGWANTSSITSDPSYTVYVVNLRSGDPSPFEPRSDEENGGEEEGKEEGEEENGGKVDEDTEVQIDFGGIQRRTLALPVPGRNYRGIYTGTAGTLFIAENKPDEPGLAIHKFNLKKRESEVFTSGVSRVSVSADGKKILTRSGNNWKVWDATKSKASDGKTLKVDLAMKVDRQAEWAQIFEEAWRYERDYFYDPGMHGRDWQQVYERYAPLVPHVKHRTDLTYLLDQMNGELSVGHSFVFGGDYPEVEKSRMGMLGADLVPEDGGWKIARIYTTESWNPKLSSPLDRPGMEVKEGYFLTGINGVPLPDSIDPFSLLDGTAGKQTVIHLNRGPGFGDSWKETVEPIGSESALRQRAWVEDNRRLVDSLSQGRLAYVWVPNTGTPGLISFDRYFFAQQDKEGAVIDERFNGGGLLDDYMVDLMTRNLRAAITNEVPGGEPMVLPAGILGPKVLLINELSGSGGDFFPWVFRQQKAGPLIGMRTWGGLVKSSVHYSLVDGGALTAPDNAVFDPVNNRWVGENEGIPPDIEVRLDARSMEKGEDPQLIRAVEEALLLIGRDPLPEVTRPSFPTPATGE